MKQLEGNYGTCYICNCMDESLGLPALDAKEYDLVILDLPYNIDAGLPDGRRTKHTRKDHVATYCDNKPKEEYYAWCGHIFEQIQRVANYAYIFCGFTNIGYWTWIQQCEYLIWKRVNSGIRSYAAFYNYQEPIIAWGKPNRKPVQDILDVYLKNGFLREGMYYHPHPKPYRLIKKLIIETEAKSVCDPMIGSGTTAEVCEAYGIPWLGFELDPKKKYWEDIEKRIHNGMKRREKMGHILDKAQKEYHEQPLEVFMQ